MSTLTFNIPQRVCTGTGIDGHPDVVVCVPPSRWANSCQIAPIASGGWKVLEYGQTIAEYETGPDPDTGSVTTEHLAKWMAAIDAVDRFCYNLTEGRLGFTVDDLRAELAGHDLGCTCPIWDETRPCDLCGGKRRFKTTPGSRPLVCYQCGGTGYARWPCHADIELVVANPSISFDWNKPPRLEPTDESLKAHPGCAYTPGLRRGQL